MKLILKLLCPLILSVLFVGCKDDLTPMTQVTTPTNAPEEPAQAQPVVQAPAFDPSSMTEDVYIQLNEEPRIHSPIRTLVAPKDQNYTVFFREPMNHDSVQEALQKNKLDGGLVPQMQFQWKEDRQLLVTVNSTWDKSRPGNAYQLDFSGAQTKSGRVLEKTPEFIAAVEEPSQLWRVSLDGKQREKMSSFEQPYDFRENDLSEGRYLHLYRAQRYCQCDAMYPRLHALYDLQEKKIIPYPVDLSQTYSGEGTFYADAARGVFYAQPANTEVPKSETVQKIQVNGYVFGASFNKDRSYVVMAVGANKDQESDYDLVLQSLKSVQNLRHVNVLHGGVPLSQADGRKLPVSFVDDGTNVYTQLTKPGSTETLFYQFTWKSGGINAQTPPTEANPWGGFKQSSDGLFTFYRDGSVYQEDLKIAQEMNLYGLWVPGTHSILVPDYVTDATTNQSHILLKLFDVEQKQFRTFADSLPISLQIINVSEDGKWVYVKSNVDLK